MKCKILSLILFLFVGSALVTAQEEVAQKEVNVDDLGNVNDDFKELFFDALSEKGKKNHDRAIDLLLKCVDLQPSNAAVHFELGKNYLMSNAFAKAEQSIKKALEIKGEDEWLLDILFDIHSKKNEPEKALDVLQKLIAININYEELLPLQFLKTGQQKKALEALNKLDERLGYSRNRNYMRQQIKSQMQPSIDTELTEESLLQKIAENSKNEEAYLKLMYLYGKQNKSEKVIEVAKKLELQLPKSDKAQLALYKIYLEQGNLDKGIKSMQRVFESDNFEVKTKIRVLNDFIQVENADTTNTQIIEDAITAFATQVEDVEALTALGDFYLKKKDPNNALSFYEKGLENDTENYDLIKKIALLSIDIKDYSRVEEITKEALEIYPAQPLLYLLNGIALNNLGEYDDAIAQLDNGLGYLLDEPKLEQDIYQQLAIAYEKKGDTTNAQKMRSKAQAITKT